MSSAGDVSVARDISATNARLAGTLDLYHLPLLFYVLLIFIYDHFMFPKTVAFDLF